MRKKEKKLIDLFSLNDIEDLNAKLRRNLVKLHKTL